MNMSRSREGFTLVELIVVIAILAILAGVGIPVYSGYIKKANEAADQQLLGVLNTAFGAACLENNIVMSSLDATTATVTLTNGKVTAVTPAEVNDSFFRYFAGNENSAFEVIDSLIFDSASNVFVETASAKSVRLSYGGGYITVSGEDAEKLGVSTFITADGLGVKGLLEKVDMTTDLAADLAGSNLMTTLLGSSEFTTAASSALQINAGDLNAKVAELAEEMVAQNPDMSFTDAVDKVKANAAVLFAAQSTTGMTSTDIVNQLKDGTIASSITSNLQPGGSTADAMSSAALAYGMYTAFAYSSYGSDQAIANTQNPSAVVDNLNNADFIKYVNSEQGKADAEAYLSALNMINSSTGDPAAVENLMVNGFADPDLADLLNQVIK
ncbi:MAG: prepilin-type N-terminal cleavage/methylation domain-containing protein [Oscillospiraceae bacterium]|nr:prepilin-type N-terminal cleavage/methylation domain-containing protein [Oscillospiraceae bacterium]